MLQLLQRGDRSAQEPATRMGHILLFPCLFWEYIFWQLGRDNIGCMLLFLAWCRRTLNFLIVCAVSESWSWRSSFFAQAPAQSISQRTATTFVYIALYFHFLYISHINQLHLHDIHLLPVMYISYIIYIILHSRCYTGVRAPKLLHRNSYIKEPFGKGVDGLKGAWEGLQGDLRRASRGLKKGQGGLEGGLLEGGFKGASRGLDGEGFEGGLKGAWEGLQGGLKRASPSWSLQGLEGGVKGAWERLQGGFKGASRGLQGGLQGGLRRASRGGLRRVSRGGLRRASRGLDGEGFEGGLKGAWERLQGGFKGASRGASRGLEKGFKGGLRRASRGGLRRASRGLDGEGFEGGLKGAWEGLQASFRRFKGAGEGLGRGRQGGLKGAWEGLQVGFKGAWALLTFAPPRGGTLQAPLEGYLRTWWLGSSPAALSGSVFWSENDLNSGRIMPAFSIAFCKINAMEFFHCCAGQPLHLILRFSGLIWCRQTISKMGMLKCFSLFY